MPFCRKRVVLPTRTKFQITFPVQKTQGFVRVDTKKESREKK